MSTHFGVNHLDQLIQEVVGLRLLILFGSRDKNTCRDQSDWDLAVALDPDQPQNWLVLPQTLATILQIPSEHLDLVALNHCSPVLGYVIAREGQLLYEAEPDLFLNFQLKAWKRYADTAYLRRYQEDYIRQTLRQLQS